MNDKNSRGGSSRADEHRGRSIERAVSGSGKDRSGATRSATASKAAAGNAARAGHSARSASASQSRSGAAARQGTSGSAARQSAARSAARQSAVNTGSKQSTSGPAAKQSAAKSGSRQSASGPAAKQGAAKSGSKQSAAKSGSKRSTSSSAARQNTRKNAPASSAKGGKTERRHETPAQRTARQRQESRDRIGDEKLRQSPEAERLRQKTEQRKGKLHQKAYSAIYFISIASFIICVAIVLSMSVLFHINTIVVESDSDVPYSQAEIIEASGISIGNNLLAASSRKAEENIPFSLPYIEHATIVKELPSTVHIKIEAAEPMGLVLNTDKQLVVVSTGGRALEVLRGSTPEHVPVINGLLINKSVLGCKVEFEKPEQFETALSIIETFRQYDLEPDSLTFSPTGNTVSAEYDRRINIRIGTVSGLEEKIELASTLIKNGNITPNEAGTLDLTIRGKGIFRPDYVEQENSDQFGFVYETTTGADEPYEVLEVRPGEPMQVVSDSSEETP